MLTPRDDSFVSLLDGLNIHAQAWIPKLPRAVIMLCHGYAEHQGRYLHVIDALNEGGYAVHALDHRGHGKSDGERAYVANFDHVIADAKQYSDRVRNQHPGLSFYVLGHSMGSLVALTFAARHPQGLAGAISSGSPVNSAESVSPALRAVASVLTRVIPKVALAETIPPGSLSRDPQVDIDFANDPLNYKGKMRIRTGTEIGRTAEWLRANVQRLSMPLLLLHGEADRVCPVSGSQWLHENAPSPHKTLKTYPNLYHEIMNEPERHQVLHDILTWLHAHISIR